MHKYYWVLTVFLVACLGFGFWQQFFLTPLVLAGMLGGRVVATKLISEEAWKVKLRKSFLFALVPVIVLSMMGDLYFWGHQGDYDFDVVCDNLKLGVSENASTELRPNRLRSVIVDGNGLQLACEHFEILGEGISDEKLKAVQGRHKLSINGLTSTPKDQLPLVVVSPSDDEENPVISIEVQPGMVTKGHRPLELNWNRNRGSRDPLNVFTQSLKQLSVRSLNFSIEVQNCEVEFGSYRKTIKDNSVLTIKGQAIQRASPVIVSFEATKAIRSQVNLNFGFEENPLRADITLTGRWKDPAMSEVQSGSLTVAGTTSSNLRQDVSITGNLHIEACHLDGNGIHLRGKGTAEKLTADNKSLLKTRLSNLLSSPVVLAFIAVLAWIIDKAFTVYELFWK